MKIENCCKNCGNAKNYSGFEDFTCKASGYGLFLTLLEYKLNDRGKYFIKVDKWYPSSQICSNCGNRHKLLLKDRIYKCDCGFVLDRDLNAAINIKKEGLRLLETV